MNRLHLVVMYDLRPRRPLLRVGVLLVALIIFGCHASEPPRNVVLVVVDTLRADHLGVYGYFRPTSPRIDSFAAQAATFENAQTPAPWTLPAVASLMTALYPTVHGATGGGKMRQGMLLADQPMNALGDGHLTLAEILRAEGFATAAFTQSWYTGAVFGFAQGFEAFVDKGTPGLRFDVEGALRWLDEREPERFFLYLHTTDVHAPYAPPDAGSDAALAEERERFLSVDFDPSYRGAIDGSVETLRKLQRGQGRATLRDVAHLVALYDRGIVYTDHWLGELFEGLAERGRWDDTLVILTSDHGEEFREHGGFQHSDTFYGELLRIPLIVRLPGVASGQRISDLVSLVDVFPTVLDALGIEQDLQVQGRSLVPLLRGESLPERPVYGEASARQGTRALLDGRFKYVYNPHRRSELYDLHEDPGERVELCATARTQCDQLHEQLFSFGNALEAARDAAALDGEALIDAETLDHLHALGYLEPESPPVGE